MFLKFMTVPRRRVSRLPCFSSQMTCKRWKTCCDWTRTQLLFFKTAIPFNAVDNPWCFSVFATLCILVFRTGHQWWIRLWRPDEFTATWWCAWKCDHDWLCTRGQTYRYGTSVAMPSIDHTQHPDIEISTRCRRTFSRTTEGAESMVWRRCKNIRPL